jgi:hypothetical protein
MPASRVDANSAVNQFGLPDQRPEVRSFTTQRSNVRWVLMTANCGAGHGPLP